MISRMVILLLYLEESSMSTCIAIIDEDICIGCGMCEEICPEVFEIDDEKAYIIADEIDEEFVEACNEATETCPVNAIRLEEE
jgi:ferredoxin